jgi:two-component system cell cycle sensor histidine kinase PleC
LIEMHGGRMRIRSTLGQGTVVTVRLPLEARQPAPAQAAA